MAGYTSVHDLPSLVGNVKVRGRKTEGREDRRRRRRQRRRRKSNKFSVGKWFYHHTISHIRYVGGEVVPSFAMSYKLEKPCKHNKSKAGAIISIADTGAAVSVMPLGHAKQLGVTIDRTRIPLLTAANSQVIKAVGITKMYVNISPCPTYSEVEFTVTMQGGDILEGNSDLKTMGIIAQDFPS